MSGCFYGESLLVGDGSVRCVCVVPVLLRAKTVGFFVRLVYDTSHES